jgi:hypothetical protein
LEVGLDAEQCPDQERNSQPWLYDHD